MKKDRKKAVALRYDGKSAPKVVAKGEGYLATQIIDVAKEHGVPMQQDEQLTALLSKVKLNDEIPQSLYVAVAQLLAYIYYLNEQQKND